MYHARVPVSPLINTPLYEALILSLFAMQEGVPQHLLQMLDDCVEIPQLGVIRSLNVHVSGACTLWQWTQQYLS
jgi:tRNA guanosine-2'-O-methyltransferase